MDALTLLTQRKSNKKLTAPAPSQVQLEQMFQAALHAPDHGKLEPYHFVVIQGTGLSKLESLLKAAVTEFDLGEERLKKAENFARRAPMVIAVIAKINHEVKKVPGWDKCLLQLLQLMRFNLRVMLLVLKVFGQLVLSLRDVNYVKHLVVTKMIRSLPYYKLVQRLKN